MCVLLLGAPPPAHSQSYPTKPVRIITSAIGGGGDFVARLLAQDLAPVLGQPLIVENRGIIGADLVAKAPPDGHTILLYGGNVWISPLMRHTSWDPVNDFAPISLPVSSPHVLAVHPSLPIKSVRDLIALARARPGQLNYAANTAGSSTHLTGELFKSMAGINMVVIHYKGSVQGINDLMSGQVQVTFASPNTVMPFVQSGRLRALAVTSEKPSALLPGMPTAAAAGLPGFEAGTTYGLFAPAKTPPVVVTRLYQETVKALNRPDMKEKLMNASIEVIAGTPAELTARIKSDMMKLGKVIKDAGIREQ